MKCLIAKPAPIEASPESIRLFLHSLPAAHLSSLRGTRSISGSLGDLPLDRIFYKDDRMQLMAGWKPMRSFGITRFPTVQEKAVPGDYTFSMLGGGAHPG